MNRDDILDVLQQPQVGYSAPLPYGAPVGEAPIFQGANLSLRFVWLWRQFLSWMIFLSAFSPGLGNQSLAFSVWAYGFPQASIFASCFTEFARMSKSPRTTTRGWQLCTPISFLSSARP